MGFRNGGDGARLRWRVERLVDGRRYHDGWGTSVCRQPRRPSNNNVTNVSSHLRYSFCPLSSYPLSPYPNSRSRDRSLRLAAGNRPAHMRWTCKKRGGEGKKDKMGKKRRLVVEKSSSRGERRKKKEKETESSKRVVSSPWRTDSIPKRSSGIKYRERKAREEEPLGCDKSGPLNHATP